MGLLDDIEKKVRSAPVAKYGKKLAAKAVQVEQSALSVVNDGKQLIDKCKKVISDGQKTAEDGKKTASDAKKVAADLQKVYDDIKKLKLEAKASAEVEEKTTSKPKKQPVKKKVKQKKQLPSLEYDRHPIVEGESLSAIAAHYYGKADENLWYLIWRLNMSLIGHDWNLIFPTSYVGYELQIPKLHCFSEKQKARAREHHKNWRHPPAEGQDPDPNWDELLDEEEVEVTEEETEGSESSEGELVVNAEVKIDGLDELIADWKKTLEDGRKTLEDGKKTFDQAKETYDDGDAVFDQARQTIADSSNVIKDAGGFFKGAEDVVSQLKETYDHGKEIFEKGNELFEKGNEYLDQLEELGDDADQIVDVGITIIVPLNDLVQQGEDLFHDGGRLLSDGTAVYGEINDILKSAADVVPNKYKKDVEHVIGLGDHLLTKAKDVEKGALKTFSDGVQIIDDCKKVITEAHKAITDGSQIASDGKKAWADVQTFYDDFKKLKLKASASASVSEKSESEVAVDVNATVEVEGLSKLIEDWKKAVAEAKQVWDDGKQVFDEAKQAYEDGKKIFDDADQLLSDGQTVVPVPAGVVHGAEHVIDQLRESYGHGEEVFGKGEEFFSEGDDFFQQLSDVLGEPHDEILNAGLEIILKGVPVFDSGDKVFSWANDLFGDALSVYSDITDVMKDGKKVIEDGKQVIEDGKKVIEDGKQAWNDLKSGNFGALADDVHNAVGDVEKTVENVKDAINDAEKTWDDTKKAVDDAKNIIGGASETIEGAKDVLKEPPLPKNPIESAPKLPQAAKPPAVPKPPKAPAPPKTPKAPKVPAGGGGGGAPKGNKLYLELKTPFAKDLSIHGFHGEERLSSPFHFTIECRSKKSTLDFKKILGKQATIKIGIGDQFRYINGHVTRFTQGGTMPDQTIYFLEIRPWLWMLTQTRDSRIFQNKSVPDIIEAVFKNYGFQKHKKSLKGSYPKRIYTVQHQESDFDFVSRLMEDVGIFYFFEHTDSGHTLVLADDPSAHKPIPGLKQVEMHGVQKSFADDVVLECALEEQVTTNTYTVGDYNFEVPKTTLRVQVKGPSPKLEVYEYPGGFANKGEGEGKAKPRIESSEEPGKTLRGQSRVRSFIPGFKFKFAKHTRADLNGEYVLRWVSHSASLDQYSNSFDAMPSKTHFRPPMVTRKPRISGSETATVVGKAGEEIWTDKYGRIKVHFPWDRLGTKDDKASCWVRVSQNWAGKQWGTWFLPRIGMEVIVTFIDGDPDRPLVTGAVYNGENTLPYALPGSQTKSTIKTNSSKGGGGYNELRFEDKKGKEEIWIQAQKDMNIKVKHDRKTDILHDEIMTVTHDRKVTIKDGDTTLTVKTGNRKVDVKTDDVLKVTGVRKVRVIGDETHKNDGNYTHKVLGDYILKVGGAMSVTVGGKLTIKVTDDIKMEGEKNISTKAGMAYKNESGTEFSNKSGTAFSNVAGTDMTNKAGVGQNVIGTQVDVKASAQGSFDGGGMMTVKGGLVMIN